jgi:hypothetical protein
MRPHRLGPHALRFHDVSAGSEQGSSLVLVCTRNSALTEGDLPGLGPSQTATGPWTTRRVVGVATPAVMPTTRRPR